MGMKIEASPEFRRHLKDVIEAGLNVNEYSQFWQDYYSEKLGPHKIWVVAPPSDNYDCEGFVLGTRSVVRHKIPLWFPEVQDRKPGDTVFYHQPDKGQKGYEPFPHVGLYIGNFDGLNIVCSKGGKHGAIFTHPGDYVPYPEADTKTFYRITEEALTEKLRKNGYPDRVSVFPWKNVIKLHLQ